MKAILNHSMLNPLASCFVPSNIIFEGKTEKYPNVKQDNCVANQKSGASMKLKPFSSPDKKGIVEKCDIFLSCKSDILDSKFNFARLVNENMYFMNDYINLASSKSECITWNPTDIDNLFESVISFCFSNQQNCHVTYDVHPENTFNKSEAKANEKCDCPPMFGCIIPPDFFGNPFGLNSSCNKKQAHVCHYSETSGIQTKKFNIKNKELDKEEESKLEQYSNELSKIIKDVCELISLAADDIEDSGYNGKIDCMFEQNATDGSDDQIKRENSAFDNMKAISINTGNLNLENIEMKTKMPKDAPLIDDFHPLLDEGISMEGYDEGISPAIKRIIKSSFSPKNKRDKFSLDEKILENVVCNPPCSVWCDSLPQPANNTYRKFIKNLSEVEQDLSISSYKSQNCIPTIGKPLYKRSFSANDGFWPKNDSLSFLTNSNKDLLRKHAESKLSHINQRTKVSRSSSLPLSEKSSSIDSEISSLNSSEDDQSTMWGPFDGEDSLWQTLPDCVPPNEHNIKQSTQRVRAMKCRRILSDHKC